MFHYIIFLFKNLFLKYDVYQHIILNFDIHELIRELNILSMINHQIIVKFNLLAPTDF